MERSFLSNFSFLENFRFSSISWKTRSLIFASFLSKPIPQPVVVRFCWYLNLTRALHDLNQLIYNRDFKYFSLILGLIFNTIQGSIWFEILNTKIPMIAKIKSWFKNPCFQPRNTWKQYKNFKNWTFHVICFKNDLLCKFKYLLKGRCSPELMKSFVPNMPKSLLFQVLSKFMQYRKGRFDFKYF